MRVLPKGRDSPSQLVFIQQCLSAERKSGNELAGRLALMDPALGVLGLLGTPACLISIDLIFDFFTIEDLEKMVRVCKLF